MYIYSLIFIYVKSIYVYICMRHKYVDNDYKKKLYNRLFSRVYDAKEQYLIYIYIYKYILKYRYKSIDSYKIYTYIYIYLLTNDKTLHNLLPQLSIAVDQRLLID